MAAYATKHALFRLATKISDVSLLYTSVISVLII